MKLYSIRFLLTGTQILKHRPLPDYLVMLGLVLYFLRGLLFNSGYPLGGDALTWLTSPQYAALNGWWYSTWDGSVFPGTVGQILSIFPILVLLYHIFQDPLGIKIFLFSFYMLMGFGMYALAYYWFKDRNIALIAAIFYLCARTVIDQTLQGQWHIVFGMALFPLVILSWEKMVNERNVKWILLAAMSFSLNGTSTHLPYLYISLFFLVPFVIWSTVSAKIKANDISLLKFIYPISLFPPVVFLLSAFFFLPVIFADAMTSWLGRPFGLLIETITRDSPSSIWNALTLTQVEGNIVNPEVYPEIFSNNLLILLPLLTFGLLIFRRSNLIVFLSFMAAVFVFLAKGLTPPLDGVYMWLIENVPQFPNHRNPTRWLFMVEFVYVILGAVAIVGIGNWIKNLRHGFFKKELKIYTRPFTFGKFFGLFIPFILVIVVLAPQMPMLKFGAQSFSVPSSHLQFYNYIKSLPGDFVVENLPFRGESGWLDPINVGMEPGLFSTWDWGIWAPSFHSKSVLGHQEWYAPSHYFLEYITHITKYKKTLSTARILGAFNVKYVAALPHASGEEREFFAKQYGLDLIHSDGGGFLYENRYWIPRLSAYPNFVYGVGGAGVLASASTFMDEVGVSPIPNLFNNDVRSEELLENVDTVLFADGDFLDMTFSSLKTRGHEEIWDAVLEIGKDRESIGNWLPSYDYALEGRYVASDSWKTARAIDDKAELVFPVSISYPDIYEVWVRVYQGRFRDKLLILLDSYQWEISPEYDIPYSGFKWVKVGEAKLEAGKYNLNIINIENPHEEQITENVLDQVAVVKSKVLESEKNRLLEIIDDHRLVFLVQESQLQIEGGGGSNYQNASDGSQIMSHDDLFWKGYIPIHHPGLFKVALRIEDHRQEIQVIANEGTEHESSVVLPRSKSKYVLDKVVADDNQASFWGNEYNSFDEVGISNNTDVKRSGTDSLEIKIYKTERSGYTLINKRYDDPISLTCGSVLAFWAKTSGFKSDLNLKILSASDTDAMTNYRVKVDDDWRYNEIELDNPLSSYGDIDSNLITEINVGLDRKDIIGSLYLDDMSFLVDPSVKDSKSEECEREEDVISGDPFSWLYLQDSLQLIGGENVLVIKSNAVEKIDMLGIFSIKNQEDEADLKNILMFNPLDMPVSLSYKKLEPSLYEVDVKANVPFVMHFSEAYHPEWRAYIDGNELKPILANGFFNAFVVDKVGEYQIIIKYRSQHYAVIGAWVSAVSWVIVLTIVIYLLGRRRFSR